ncbi:MAG: type secretion system protein, partial [Planctomycetaceae bacterium]|nr:type secretion system protein [Planctomycetaceae bacterium]
MQRKYAIGLFLFSSLLAGGDARLVFGQEKAVVENASPASSPAVVPTTPGTPAAPAATTPGAAVPGAASQTPMPSATGTPGAAPMTPATAVKPLSRADRPTPAANADELKVQPDSKGLVKFNFQGQPWLEVLEWLAKISHLSLDWQELPGDHLNLATQRAYTVVEARDLINRHLLDRGYTLLRNGEVLTVVNIKKLDPSLVPRVKPSDLVKRDPHEFVKVSFPLDWLLAEHAVEEMKPMLSPNGKLQALKSTNRMEAMDAVTNLLEIYEVLTEEQSRDGKEQLVQEFPLKHTRAADVDRMLRALMGMQKNQDGEAGGGGSPAPDQFMAIQQQLQQMQQMQQQQQQQPPQPGVGGPKKEVFIVVNAKRNSLLVQAPADKMAVIAQAVQHLDVGNDKGGSLMHAINSTKIYRLSEIDPTALAKILEEMGNLDPTTRIKVDAKHRSLVVTGALADHVVISELIKKLDGTDRKFEVIRLRRLQADYVAGTIEFMMGVGKKEENDNMNPFMAYRFGMDFGGGGGGDKGGSSKFRVSADTENNRLLLWTNDVEMKEVHNLLIKLGEMPSKDGNPDRVRVIEAGGPQAAKRLAEQLLKTRPEFKIEIQEEPIAEPQTPDEVAPKLEQLVPSAKGAAAQTKQPQVRKSIPSPKAAAQLEPQSTQVAAPRRPGQSGRILQAGRAVSNVTLASLQQVSRGESDSESDSEPAPRAMPPKSQSSATRPSKPIFNPNRALLPTFAPEPDDEATGAEDASENDQVPIEPSVPKRVRRKLKPQQSEFSSEQEPGPAVGIDRPVIQAAPGQPELGGQEAEAAPKANPVQVIVTANGQLIMASSNTQALDELEDMITQISPPRRDFKIFHLKNRSTWATGVVWNLEKYFGTEKEKGGGMKYSPYWGIYPSDKKDDGPNSLSKRRIPKFIADSDSRTILVTGADPEQLRVIQELIDIYDRPDVSDNKALRLTKIFQLKHSKARIVADAVKEVYRDLLSANDPALQAANQNNKDQKPVAAERQYTYIYGGAGEGDKDKNKEPEAPIKFKGLLSMGVDELSNTVIVSAQEGLLENIGQMIDSLDVAARPTQNTIQVMQVNRYVEASGLHERLSKLL